MRLKAIRPNRGMLVYLVLVGLAFAINYPGRLNPDSIDQLTQAVHPQFLNDWHEPWCMSVWRLFSPLLGEPAGALLAQSLLLLVYPAQWIGRTVAAGERSALAWTGLAVFTLALIEIAGQIVKDALLLGFLLCFLAVLDRPNHRQNAPLAIALALAASLVRPVNALLFAPAASAAVFTRWTRWRLPVLLLIILVCIGQVPVARFLDAHVWKARHADAESSVIIFDLAGMSTLSHTDLFAAIPDWPSQQLARPWDCYTPYYWDPFRWGRCGRYFDLFNARVPHRSAFWLTTILAHPGAYAIHRARYVVQSFRAMAPIATFQAPAAVNRMATQNALFGPYTHGTDMRANLQLWHPTFASRLTEWIAAIVFSRPLQLVEMAACLAGFYLGTRRKARRIDMIGFTAAGIGVMNILLIALFGAAAEGRYFLPAFVCGLLIIMRTFITRPATAKQPLPDLAPASQH